MFEWVHGLPIKYVHQHQEDGRRASTLKKLEIGKQTNILI